MSKEKSIGNLKKRKIKDGILNGFTGISSVISVVILLSIIIFVFVKGIANFDFRMITSDFYDTPYFARVHQDFNYSFLKESEDGIYYSKNYGIGFEDGKDMEGNPCVFISFIDKESPINNAIDISSGKSVKIKTGQIIKRVQVSDDVSSSVITPKEGAETIAKEIDKYSHITELYYSTMGGGIRGSLLTTFVLIGVTLIIAMPIGIIAAIYLALYAKRNRITEIFRTLIDMISGVPSIIFGLIGVIIFIPFVSKMSNGTSGNILSGSLTLSIMLLPTIIKTTEESINNIPKGYKLSSLALGASETQTILKVILPNAISGILTSILLSIGRIIGESAALIFAIGTSIQDRISLFGESTSLAVHIWSLMAGDNPNYGKACAISIIILIIVFILNIVTKIVCKKLNRFEVK